MEESEQDKSERPTSFKLTRARQKGAVARGMDLGFLTALAAFLGYVWIAGPLLGGAVGQAARGAFVGGLALADGDNALLSAVALLLSPVVRPLVLLLASVFLVVLLFEIVQTGVVFSAQPLKPDFSRLNPANGLKRLFSPRLLLETLKNVLKLAVYTTLAFLIIRAALRSDIGSVHDASGLVAVQTRTAMRLIAVFVLGAIGFAVLDQLIVRRQFLKKMLMSRREVRRESRDREGDPRFKQKRKQLHREFAKASQSLRGLRNADVLITNPQHVAVALRYEPATMQAPMLVSAGINHLAQRLKRLAFLYGIPIIESRALARELFGRSALNGPIPEDCFQPVADIYNAIRRRSDGRNADRQRVA